MNKYLSYQLWRKFKDVVGIILAVHPEVKTLLLLSGYFRFITGRRVWYSRTADNDNNITIPPEVIFE